MIASLLIGAGAAAVLIALGLALWRFGDLFACQANGTIHVRSDNWPPK